MANTADFDIILYGASSFVGQILSRYLLEHFDQNSIKWAIAGRSASKLEALKADIGAPDLEVIIADADDDDALIALCAKTRVVISTVGPYALYGEPLVRQCALSGTHYCDLTGETQWIKRMQDLYEADAKRTGARIVHCCGFDSIPSDMGVHFLQSLSAKKFGEPCVAIKMGVGKFSGGVSGGTVASMVNLAKEAGKDPALRKELANPYSICPPGHSFTARQHNVGAEYDQDYKSWVAPFVMAAINTRVVHRSNALKDNAYGDSFTYQEAMLTGPNSKGKNAARMAKYGMGAFMLSTAIGPIRWALEKTVLPKPGEGPSEKQQLEGHYELHFLGRTSSGDKVRATVSGDRDPGYGSTAKMLAQSAACLAQDRPDDDLGGFWTPASLLGDALIERLEANAGLKFTADEA